MNIADLALKERDPAGVEVLQFYARKPPEYAVYQTSERVTIQFADAPDKADEQRKALAQLAPLRGELNGLIDGWRDAPNRMLDRPAWLWRLAGESRGARLRRRAARYDRRVADALVVALEGDLTGGGAVLENVKSEVLAERVGWARFQYLIAAVLLALGFMLFASLIAAWQQAALCPPARDPRCFDHATDLWRGGMAGALGSFFSIALAIRGRTVLPDLNRQANMMDAALRVAIGIIAGVVFVALVLSGFVNLAIGRSDPAVAGTLYIGLCGFLAGFSERMVPDLLAKAEERTGERPVLRKPEPELEAKPEPGAAPTGRTGGAAAPAALGSEPEVAEAHVDGCVADVPIAEAELTPDAMLPVASGGVALTPEGSSR